MTGAGIRRLAIGTCALVWATVAYAGYSYGATPPPAPPVATSCDSCSATLSVTASSARVALPVNVANQPSLNAVTILNTGSKDAFYKLGDVTAAAVTTNTRVPANGPAVVVYVNGATYLAAITAGSDTTTLQIWQGNGPMLGARMAPAGGGGGSGTVTEVDTGLGLTGGPITTSGSISLNVAGASIGGVKASAATTHKFLTAISSVDGSVSNAQPACADISDAGVFCAGTSAASLSGVVGSSHGGAGSVTGVLAGDGSGNVSQGASTGLSDSAALARLASPTFTGSPAAPTPSTGDNSTLLATTAFVKAQSYSTATGANPTATIGATAVNGTSLQFMRADGAPALPATLPALSGVNLTALNASNLASGTVADARLSANVPLLNAANAFSAQQMAQGATGTSPGWYAQITGDAVPRVRVGLNVNDVASIGFGSGSAPRDLFIERASPATLRLGTNDTAAPVGQTIIVQNVAVGTSNTAGAPFAINLSQGTGTGVGGNLTINCAPHGTTGTAQNALSACLAINGDTKAVTFSGAIGVGGAAPSSSAAINASGNIFVSALIQGQRFSATAVASTNLALGGVGTNFGQVNNVDAHTWALGYGSSASANGTEVISWTDNGGVTITPNNGVTTITGVLIPASFPLTMGKATDPGTAPGAGFCKKYWVAGTNSGTGKEIAYCGISTTPSTIIDNVGGGF